MQGVLHVHSENSLNDSALSISEICQKAKEKGYEAVALTDNGNMTGIAQFIREASTYGIKSVPGVESYILEIDDSISRLVLMAKDYTGYVGLCKAVSEANKDIGRGYPVLRREMLQSMFMEGSPYHGHVIAMSSGIEGILSKTACKNSAVREQELNLRKEIKAISVTESDIERQNGFIGSLSEEISKYKEEKEKLVPRAKKSFKKKEDMLNSISEKSDLYQEKWKELQEEKTDSLIAEKQIESLNGKINRRKKKLKEAEKEIEKLRSDFSKKESLEKKLAQCAGFYLDEGDLIEAVKAEACKLRDTFGECFYIELMFHGNEEEAFCMPLLARAAWECGIKTVISNDVHILEPTYEDILKCQIVRSLKNNKWVAPEEYAAQYCMKSVQELKTSLLGFLPEEVIEQSFKNMDALFNCCSFEWPAEKHYPKYQDVAGRCSDDVLEETVRKNVKKKYTETQWDQEHADKLDYELSVIKKTGYSDYTLIISEILEEGRKGRKDGTPGCYIGPGRGSGAGSLVNYLMGITDIDPMEYGLIFERYLNIERISPPDIDSDIATSIRGNLVKYITQKYSVKDGKIGVCAILTKSRLTAKAAVRAAGRVVSARMYGNAATLYTVADKISKAIPNDQHIRLGDCIDGLTELFEDDVEQEILTYARLIEGVMSGYSTHAAGIIISDNGDITDYAPVINVGTTEAPVWNIQYDMGEAESIGLLKLDALGLTTLDVNTNTVQRIFRTTGKRIDLGKIPFEKQVFTEIYAKGDTNGVFQCESPGMKKMWKELKPDCIEDIIAGIALFRPGPMDFIPKYIQGKKNHAGIRYLTPELKPILEKTYGCIVYQEQVMQIVRDLAGYSMGRSDLVRRAMSKKKEAIMEAERKNFVYGNPEEGIPGCISNGIPEKTAQKIYDTMIDFAKYAFNKSHAAAYAIVSYQSAWLKYHYPKEFLIETMNLVKPEKIPSFLEECRRKGYQVMLPDINLSSAGFTEYDGNIIYGLGIIKGVKSNAEKIIKNRNGHYDSFAEYLLHSGANKAVTRMLIKSGAFSNICPSRKGLLMVHEKMAEKAGEIKKIKQRILLKEEKLKESLNKKDAKRIQSSLNKDMLDYENKVAGLKSAGIPLDMHDTPQELMDMEKESLFSCISVHPLDCYDVTAKDLVPLNEVNEPMDICAVGIITSVRYTKRKKDGKEMAIFDLEDRTGKIRGICWPSAYDKYRDLIQKDNAVKIYGKCRYDRGDEETLVLFPDYIGMLVSTVCQVLIKVENMNEWETRVKGILTPYEERQGHQVLLYDQDSGRIHVIDMKVNDRILECGLDVTYTKRHLTIGG